MQKLHFTRYLLPKDNRLSWIDGQGRTVTGYAGYYPFYDATSSSLQFRQGLINSYDESIMVIMPKTFEAAYRKDPYLNESSKDVEIITFPKGVVPVCTSSSFVMLPESHFRNMIRKTIAMRKFYVNSVLGSLTGRIGGNFSRNSSNLVMAEMIANGIYPRNETFLKLYTVYNPVHLGLNDGIADILKETYSDIANFAKIAYEGILLTNMYLALQGEDVSITPEDLALGFNFS